MQNSSIRTTKMEGGFWYILALMCSAHFINDATQALLPAIYPLLQQTYSLSLLQLGIITATFQIIGSLFQPLVGYIGDKRPLYIAVVLCFLCSIAGVIILAYTHGYYYILLSAALIGMASSLFHPEASRISRAASGGRYGAAQSIFQIGGNFGTALGPLLAALFIYQQKQLIYLLPFLLLGLIALTYVTSWYSKHLIKQKSCKTTEAHNNLDKSTVIISIIILIALMFAKYVYLSTFQNYYTLYVIEKFHLSMKAAQIMLFLFLSGVAIGTVFGGPMGDRFGSRNVIWFSILGILPFTLILPYVGLVANGVLSVAIGAILASAFPAIVVYAQELVPGKVGTIGGCLYGFAYGIGGLSSCVMGYIGDYIGLEKLFIICGFLPLLGALAIFLPKFENKQN